MQLRKYIKFTPRSLFIKGLFFASISANIYAQDNSFYFDSGLSYNKFHVANKAKGIKVSDSKLFKDKNTGVNFVLGKRFGDLGVEAGFTMLGEDKYRRTTQSKASSVVQTLKHENVNYTADINYYINLIDNLELKSSLGLGILQTKTKYNVVDEFRKKILPQIKNSEAEIKPRVGIGLQYAVTRSWVGKWSVNYQGGNQYYKTLRSTMLSVTYKF